MIQEKFEIICCFVHWVNVALRFLRELEVKGKKYILYYI